MYIVTAQVMYMKYSQVASGRFV